MTKQSTNINESLLATTCEVLRRIEEIVPKHDLTIKSLEPRINSLAEELKEQQKDFLAQMEEMVEHRFRRMEEKVNLLMQEHKELMNIFCRLHTDTVELLEASFEAGADKKIIEKTTSMALVLEKYLLDRGIENIILAQDVFDKKGAKKRKVMPKDKDKK